MATLGKNISKGKYDPDKIEAAIPAIHPGFRLQVSGSPWALSMAIRGIRENRKRSLMAYLEYFPCQDGDNKDVDFLFGAI